MAKPVLSSKQKMYDRTFETRLVRNAGLHVKYALFFETFHRITIDLRLETIYFVRTFHYCVHIRYD
jgi:hypothetical protein